MLIVFSRHALIKIGQRKINKQFVLDTIKDPELVRHSLNLREELYRKFARNYLKVVVKRTKSAIIVVTTHWVAKISNKL